MSLDMLYEALDILERLFYNSQVDFFEYTNAFIGINSGISQILEQYNCPTTFNI